MSAGSAAVESAISRSKVASWAASEGSRRSMKANRRSDTAPERRVRSALHVRGRRFRKDYRLDLPDLRVRVDIAFPRARVALFVDGCFWHRCPEHGSDPKRNAPFWERKLKGNVARDRRIDDALVAAGWTVVRCWEHEPPVDVATRVDALLGQLGPREDG